MTNTRPTPPLSGPDLNTLRMVRDIIANDISDFLPVVLNIVTAHFKVHSGDCTKEAHTCGICMVEDEIKDREPLLKALDALIARMEQNTGKCPECEKPQGWQGDKYQFCVHHEQNTGDAGMAAGKSERHAKESNDSGTYSPVQFGDGRNTAPAASCPFHGIKHMDGSITKMPERGCVYCYPDVKAAASDVDEVVRKIEEKMETCHDIVSWQKYDGRTKQAIRAHFNAAGRSIMADTLREKTQSEARCRELALQWIKDNFHGLSSLTPEGDAMVYCEDAFTFAYFAHYAALKRCVENLKILRNHSSVSSQQIELIDKTLAELKEIL